MKKILFLLVFAFATTGIFASERVFNNAIRLGTAYSFSTGNDAKYEFDNSGYTSSLTYDMKFQFAPIFALHVPLGLDISVVDGDITDGFDNYTITYVYMDFEFGALARFNFIPNVFAEVGPILQMNVISAYDIKDGNSDTMENMSPMNISLAFGAGYTFDFGLELDARFIYGISSRTDYPDQNVDYALSHIQVGVSYWFMH